MEDENLITSDDILGKDVVDTQGEVLGVIQKLHIDKNNKSIVGITIDQGFMKPDLFIGLEYIDKFGIDTIFLNTYPKDKIKGMDVINYKGRKIGYVIDIEYSDKNKIKNIKIKKGILNDPVEIPISKIKKIGYTILLKEID